MLISEQIKVAPFRPVCICGNSARWIPGGVVEGDTLLTLFTQRERVRVRSTALLAKAGRVYKAHAKTTGHTHTHTLAQLINTN